MLQNKKSVGKNYIYNLIYEIFILIVPVAITPYVSRVLGEEGSGQYSYIYSIVTYFTLFAALGFGKYAQRLVAQHQCDKYKQSVDFWEVILARLVSVLMAIFVYIVLMKLEVYGEKYNILVLIFTINIIAVAFDITFFFQGNEEFKIMVFRNIVVKTIGFICIFIFVKSSQDLWKYTLIQSLMIVLSNLSLWMYLPRYLEKISWHDIHPIQHIVPTLFLFLPTIAVSIYTSLDKTLIGLITKDDAENGNYEYAEKIVKMALTVITSLGTVMIPRNSQQFANGKFESVKKNIENSLRFVMLAGIPMMLGLMAVADNMIPWYLGGGYDKAANLIKILSPIIVIIGFSNVLGLQYLLPSGADKEFTIAIITGAVTNFILNCILIRYTGSYGAAVATVIAESVVTIVMFGYVKEKIHINPNPPIPIAIKNIFLYFVILLLI